MTSSTSETNARQTGWPTWGVPLAALLALVGLGLSAVLLQHHIAIAIGADPLLSAVCDVSENSSCDAVLRSEWAWFRGLPTALWGFFFFAAIFAWYLVIGQPAPGRRYWHLLPVLATAAATGVCAGLAYLMYTRLPQWCPLCAATHVLTALLFVVTVLLWPRGKARSRAVVGPGGETRPLAPGESVPSALDHAYAAVWPPARPSIRQICVAILLAGAISAAASGEYYRRLHKATAADFKARWQVYASDLQMVYNRYLQEPRVDIPVSPADSVRGPANAPHTLVMFADFQCEFCRVAEKMIREKLEANPGHLRVVFKHYPMNSKCNRYVKNVAHAAACATAVTAEAARILGGEDAFWKMHDALFARPAQFARRHKQFLRETCERIGLQEDELWNTIQTTAAWSRVHDHEAQAHAIGVRSTPALYLDGRRLTDWGLSKFWDYIFAMDKQSGRVAATTRPAALTNPSNR